ncbi:MAG: GatB/YqeY domain-containing protein [Pseudobacteriovorax sp.]|nr:GatB/YqeY domain-containing protein [Pseudobacteriovorax sp.]
MLLMDKISSDIKQSMKNKDKFRTQVLRMVLSECKYALTDSKDATSLSDEETIKILGSYQKRLVKSLDDYPDGEKKDTIQDEIKIVSEYLPTKLGETETQKVIDNFLSQTEERQFGVLMKGILAELGSGGDGKLVSRLLKKSLEPS